jgi:TrpR-related protein YerC/YecD
MKKSNRRIQNSDMYRAILTLKTEEECKAFFTDLCSITELMAMEQRYEVAKLLNEGLIYNIIMERSGTSSAIISRVNRSLQYGSGGYGIVFSRLYGEKKEEGEEEEPKD